MSAKQLLKVKSIVYGRRASKEATQVPGKSLNLTASIHSAVSSSLHLASSIDDAAAEIAEEETGFFQDYMLSLVDVEAWNKQRNEVALFDSDEIILGPKLGAGEFSNVYELQSFALDPDARTSSDESEKRIQMKKKEKYRMTDNARYALKHIKESYLTENGEEAYIQAAVDLALEAELLASLNHPNIIKLRGSSLSGAAGFANGPCGYFLIVDRLFETLDRTIKRWHGASQERKPVRTGRMLSRLSRMKSARRFTDPGTSNEMGDGLMDNILSAALQISAAMTYLHKHSIIFRDLKPDNIGFDVRGDVKIFDFGLARIIPEGGNPHNDKFEMSGAGSPRYMAPELLAGKDYNLKADVYTFAVVMWQMLSGETPYSFIRNDIDDLQYYIVEAQGRPKIDKGWPDPVKRMLGSSFDADVEQRPNMRVLYETIRKVLSSLRGDDTRGLTNSAIQRRRNSLHS